jgi:small subunit ribosomal protein S1
VFEGHKLTIDEYERVETAYVDAFVAFAEDSDVERLEVRSLETDDVLEEGASVSLGAAGDIVRQMLREEVICKLESPTHDFALHVGFDLYMYVGSARPCPRGTERANESGLFVEDDWPSPQLPDDE